MGLFPEREPKSNVYERPDEASPLTIERKEVVTPVPTSIKAIVDDNGVKLAESPEAKKIQIEIPALNTEDLTKKSKGSIDETPAWSAWYWLRMIKKAFVFGWKVVFGQ